MADARAYVSVRLLDLPYPADREYCYELPGDIAPSVRTGTMLVVPFGRADKQMTAVAVGFPEKADFPRIKRVLQVLDYPFEIPEEFVRLSLFMKDRFFCSFGQAFRTILPPGINVNTEIFYVLPSPDAPKKKGVPGRKKAEDPRCAELLKIISGQGEITEKSAVETYGDDAYVLLGRLVREGKAEKRSRVPKTINEKTVTSLSLLVSAEEAEAMLEDTSKGCLTSSQKTLVELLMHYPCATLREVAAIGGVGPAVVSALVRKGVVEKTEKRLDRTYGGERDDEETKKEAGPLPELTEEQANAVKAVRAQLNEDRPSAALLFGVTGSGKTRVIIESVRETLKNGRTAIVLLPEIGLTAQAAAVYRSAFGKQLAVIHSMLSIGERLDAYRAMREGKIRVVLGTRSAVFSPLERPGLIVLDEEQESTYKSENAPRYHARDIARFRCSENNAVMLLSSATPSVESFYTALKGNYTLIRLTRRAGESKLPSVEIADVRGDEETLPDRMIGTELRDGLSRVLSGNRQAILFANRRGYQSHVSCRACGHPFQCPNCSVSMTYHAYEGRTRSSGKLICHYCGYTDPFPKTCPSCGSGFIGTFGFGTQKLEEELAERFPDANIARMDTDTTSGRDSHEQILSSFGRHESDILCGTQMVTKGLDFPAVDLVGVVSADSLLYQSDFRAGEKAFSLFTQLIGRAGRAGQSGKAILQTLNPGNEILRLSAKQDYEAFYASEIRLRKAVRFPPFCSLLSLTVSSADERLCEQWAETVGERFRALFDASDPKPAVRQFGPYPAGLYRIGKRYRRTILFKYSDRAAERAFFSSLLVSALTDCPKDVRVEPDANPLHV